MIPFPPTPFDPNWPTNCKMMSNHTQILTQTLAFLPIVQIGNAETSSCLRTVSHVAALGLFPPPYE